MTRRISVSSLIWGLVFCMIASLGLWIGLGGAVNWKALSIAAPIVLIALAALGLGLARPRS